MQDYQQVADPFDQLTARERQVLQLRAEGKVAKEIATFAPAVLRLPRRPAQQIQMGSRISF